MDTRAAYNSWASQYDANENRTRDLEAVVLREMLAGISFTHCLEVGCGTGKNTTWLVEKGTVTGIDLSEEMLAKAKEKVGGKADFLQVDVTAPWPFEKAQFDLITFSLMLEHIENLSFIFSEAARVLQPGGYVYLGELHPFKQYSGSKARFETADGVQVVTCFNHHVSDFAGAAAEHGFSIVELREYFDENDRRNLPRILTLLFRRN